MKKVLVIMEDDQGGPQVVRGDCPAGVEEKDAIRTQIHTRSMIAQLIAMAGVNVIEAANGEQVVRTLNEKGDDVGIALIVEQEAGSKKCLGYLATIRAKFGERIKVIGVAETVECMEEMQALRVSKLLGAPMGCVDLSGVLNAVQEYIER